MIHITKNIENVMVYCNYNNRKEHSECKRKADKFGKKRIMREENKQLK